DAFFTPKLAEDDVEEETTKEEEKIERIQQAQEERKEELAVENVEKKEEADLIYAHYGTVQSVLDAINRAKDSGMSWSELKSRIESESSPEADAVQEIREHDGVVVLRLGNKDVEIDFRKSVEQNASDYYDEMKKAKKKLAGVKEAMKQFEEKKQVLKEEPAKERKQLLPTPKRRKKWYEKFHWFLSSDGYLIIGGKDAKQNDLIYSKHMEPDDFVFHADIQGASLVVAKGQDGKKPSEIAIKEASEFSAAHSKAWSKGLTKVDVFCVGPGQVSKSPPSGASLPHGSFMISGQRLWFHDVELKLAIGVIIDEYKGVGTGRVLAGSVMSMRKHALAFVTIRPGFKKAPEIAGEIKTRLQMKVKPEEIGFIESIPANEFEALVPAAQAEIIDG
ncbi:MAG: NFACT RNA binding domain-containing protein, partial [Candidatus Aenigmatarchaeota archaeon]